MSQPTVARTDSSAAQAMPSRRRTALLVITAALLLLVLGFGAYWALVWRWSESTDNAYAQAPMVLITPQVGGTVIAVLADDTDLVREGQPLVRLDPSDARLALERAESQLAQTVREVRTLYANNAALDATIRLRAAEVARMAAEAARAQDDVARRRPLVASGAVAGEEMLHAEATLASAQSAQAGARSALVAAQEQAASNRALTEGTNVAKHPSVQRAAAAVREAYLAVQRNELLAPVTGQVARRSVQVGQRIAPGAPLMAVVPLHQAWVEANFKEVQLRQMRIGQPATVQADLYGSRVEYRGRVAGVGAGTGAAFALLPAQNATGNWIKVVQRVPVRIELDAQQLAAHPLRVGLSMEVTVNLRPSDGAPLLGAATAPHAASTPVFTGQTAEADQRVQAIITANLGRDRPPARASAGAQRAAAPTR
jgi:membrane fusion protein (multidrug efflux system)